MGGRATKPRDHAGAEGEAPLPEEKPSPAPGPEEEESTGAEATEENRRRSPGILFKEEHKGLEAEPEYASEMEIIVRRDAVRSYVLLADGDNIVDDVLVEILGRDRAGRAPAPRLFFNDLELQKQKTLTDCGIKHGSVLHLKCTPQVLAHTDEPDSFVSPTKIVKKGYAESSSALRPNGDGEMEIFVQSVNDGNYALEVDSSNTIMDVFITVLPSWEWKAYPKPKLYFSGHLLERAKSLADYGIQDGSILHLECPEWIRVPCSSTMELRNNLGRKKIIITKRILAIWEKKHDKILLGLLVEQIQIGGRKALDFENDSWREVVAKFNEATGLEYENKHLHERFNFCKREYEIVSNIRHHPEFSWDHWRQVVIATDAKWNEYIKDNPNAKCYRRRAVPFIDLLENVFAEKEE